ncbi:MAG: tRNA pseudouridine(13) synthase TruD [Candidatus Thermoplasmatota archaeon]
MNSAAFEHTIGIETYFTQEPGCGGKLRTVPEDFTVQETFHYPSRDDTGIFTIAEISCRNWETNTLIREISKKLRISRNRISFAGTKDKRSVNTRLMSFASVSPESLQKLKIKDVEIKNIFKSKRPVKLGDLYGNYFTITIRNISNSYPESSLKKNLDVLTSSGGFPNFFGIQRFGAIRPINHLIGKYIVSGDFEQAVMTYLTAPCPEEDPMIAELRSNLKKTYDFTTALHQFPNHLNFEKAILNNLVVNPSDFLSALQQLPKNLLLMFINAYQSYLFNKMLSERMHRKLPLHQACIGDIILPFRNNVVSDEYITVSSSNSAKINEQVQKQKAFVSCILVGFKPVFSSGEMGEIEHEVFKQEKIDVRDFVIPDIPFLSSRGSRRSILAPLRNLTYHIESDTYHEGKKAVMLSFSLLKGCYATSFLREIMKSENSRDY